MTQDAEQEPAQPQRRQMLIAAASIAGMSLAMQSPPLAVLAGESGNAGNDLLASMLQALGQRLDGRFSMQGAALELHLTRILRAPPVFEFSAQDLKQRILHNIEADYRNGAIRVVDGWWLSQTEANCLELIEQVRAG